MENRLQDVESQISEIEMLRSMFPGENDVRIEDEYILALMNKYIDNREVDPLKMLTVHLKLKIEDVDCLADAAFTLPLNYPSEKLPDVIIRCNEMNKLQQRNINEEIKKFTQNLIVGDLCLNQIVEWITRNCDQYLTVQDKASNSGNDASIPQEHSDQIARLWIYSHHIYSKTKRKHILDWSKELNLTGFSMPGKPGIVCVEGYEEDCEDFWQRMKRQTWKRLSLVHKEKGGNSDPIKEGFESKFKDPVAEINFGVHGGRDYHMDLGQFAEYLAKHKSHDMFQLLFGVEGVISKKEDD